MSRRIAPLAEREDAIPVVAGWHLAEWGHHDGGRSRADSEARLRRHLGPDPVPHTWLALEGQTPVGAAALVRSDMKTRAEWTPWLADVVVDPAWRRRGIGAALVRRAMEGARERCISRLYLFTPDQERLYARLGWTVVERTGYRGESVVVMAIDLDTGDAG